MPAGPAKQAGPYGPAMPDLVLATSNPHKVEELRALLARAGLPGRILGLNDLQFFRPLREPEETGRTFEENAVIKATAYASQTRMLCLADDSGLEVDALAGRPGVISSHYATDGRETGLSRPQRDAANNVRLLRELEGLPPEARSGRFVCVMALASPGLKSDAGAAPAILATTRGTFEGRIGVPPAVPRGAAGFGYDPLFLVGPDFARTSAELDPEEKNRLSHRGAAARAMADRLRALS